MSDLPKKLKEMCQIIGCSGVDPDMCQNKPQNCEIIRKVAGSSFFITNELLEDYEVMGINIHSFKETS